MSRTRQILWAYAAAILSLSVFLAIPALGIGIFTGRIVDLVGWYVGFFVAVNLLLALLLAPLLPLLIWATNADLWAKAACVLLVPPYFVLVLEIDRMLGNAFLSLAKNGEAPLESLFTYLIAPAALIVLNFFVIEADLRRRSAA